MLNTAQEYLTVPEVAQRLAVPKNSVRRYIYRGWLKATKWGRGNAPWRIKLTDLEEFISGGNAADQRSGAGSGNAERSND